MWLGLLDFFYSPVTLLVSLNLIIGPMWLSKNKNATSPCLPNNQTGADMLFFDDGDPQIRGCYPSESHGPCPENMKLYSIDGGNYGQCNCDALSQRILLYNNKTNRCYPIFQQGYCALGEQLVTTRENPSAPVCQRTACYEELIKPENKDKDLVPYNSNTTCVEVGSQCTSPRVGRIGFERDIDNKVILTCTNPRARAISVPPMRCSPGTYRAITGHCQPPIFSFDDD